MTMAVAPALSTTHFQLSDWSTGVTQMTNKYSTQVVQTENNNPNNHSDLLHHPQQPASQWFPIAMGLTIGVLAGALVLGTVTSLWLTARLSTTTSITATTTAVPIVTAIWNFNNDTNDQYNIYNGTAINLPNFVNGYTNVPKSALNFIGSSSQYVTINSPFLSLANRSFTVEVWFYATSLSAGSYGLFGQCQTSSMDLCLTFMIENYHAYLGFYSDDQMGVASIPAGVWTHIAFVYDYPTSTQSIYVNGILDVSRSSNSYQGTAGPILIGAADNGTKSYFTGYIDQVSLITRTKTVTEILNDATLICYFSFDSNLFIDSGPWGLTSSVVNVTTSYGYGRVNDAISFTSASSYFVVGGLRKLGVVGRSYSLSIWINPTSVSGGTIAHVSSCNYGCSGVWCLAFIGFSSTGQIVVQSLKTTSGNLVALTGPIAPTNVWTHVVQTYSSTNGLSFYVNGSLTNQSSAFTYWASGATNYIYLGSLPFPPCVYSNTISMGQYYGLLDEFRVFTRELSAAEVYALATL